MELFDENGDLKEKYEFISKSDNKINFLSVLDKFFDQSVKSTYESNGIDEVDIGGY